MYCALFDINICYYLNDYEVVIDNHLRCFFSLLQYLWYWILERYHCKLTHILELFLLVPKGQNSQYSSPTISSKEQLLCMHQWISSHLILLVYLSPIKKPMRCVKREFELYISYSSDIKIFIFRKLNNCGIKTIMPLFKQSNINTIVSVLGSRSISYNKPYGRILL